MKTFAMAITSKTRKMLWSNSGSRCALCRRKLIQPETEVDDATIVGDECHIISPKRGGPRHRGLPSNDYDKLENLLILCKIHHTVVDSQHKTYTVERLYEIKEQHERWVDQRLTTETERTGSSVIILPRLTTGKELMAMNSDCMAFIFDHDEPESEAEMELIGGFLQTVQDWGEIWSEVDMRNRLEAQFGISKWITQLEEAGFGVFGVRQTRRVDVIGQSPVWPVFIMMVVRKTNQGITPLGELAAMLNVR